MKLKKKLLYILPVIALLVVGAVFYIKNSTNDGINPAFTECVKSYNDRFSGGHPAFGEYDNNDYCVTDDDRAIFKIKPEINYDPKDVSVSVSPKNVLEDNNYKLPDGSIVNFTKLNVKIGKIIIGRCDVDEAYVGTSILDHSTNVDLLSPDNSYTGRTTLDQFPYCHGIYSMGDGYQDVAMAGTYTDKEGTRTQFDVFGVSGGGGGLEAHINPDTISELNIKVNVYQILKFIDFNIVIQGQNEEVSREIGGSVNSALIVETN